MFTNRPDLLEAAARSIRAQEAEGIEPVCKIDSGIQLIKKIEFTSYPDLYEFPHAVVEKKAVFTGDEIYSASGKRIAISHSGATGTLSHILGATWNPPAPKEPEVELPEGFTACNNSLELCTINSNGRCELLFVSNSGYQTCLECDCKGAHHMHLQGSKLVAYRVIPDTTINRTERKQILESLKLAMKSLEE